MNLEVERYVGELRELRAKNERQGEEIDRLRTLLERDGIDPRPEEKAA